LTGMLLNWAGPDLVVPETPPVDLAVAPYYEKFDGLTALDNPATGDPISGGTGTGSMYGFDRLTEYPRPGALDTPVWEQTYTRGPIAGLTNSLGGQPLSAVPVSDRIHRPPGTTQRVTEFNTQQRLGVGQAGPSSLGVANTVQMGELVNNPPEPTPLDQILSGWG
jgi:hypothetical protein